MLGKRINELRFINNISQTTLAKAFGVSKQSVSNWENGYVIPSIAMLKKLCDFFSVSSDYLLGINPTRENIVFVDGLTEKQISHINFIINDYKELNKKINQISINESEENKELVL